MTKKEKVSKQSDFVFTDCSIEHSLSYSQRSSTLENIMVDNSMVDNCYVKKLPVFNFSI